MRADLSTRPSSACWPTCSERRCSCRAYRSVRHTRTSPSASGQTVAGLPSEMTLAEYSSCSMERILQAPSPGRTCNRRWHDCHRLARTRAMHWRRGAATNYHVAKCRRASPAKNRQGVVMVRRPLLAIAVAMPMLGGLAAPAWCQATKATAAAALDPAPSAAPDPLTPPRGEYAAASRTGRPRHPRPKPPSPRARPIPSWPWCGSAWQRQRPQAGTAGDRDDYAGLVAFYAEHAGEAVWTSKERLHATGHAGAGRDPQGR